MKNLIGLFFIASTFVGYSQNTKKEEIVEYKATALEVAEQAPQEIAKLPPKVVKQEATDVKADILNAFSTGKANLLSKYFPANIDINILGKSNLYSKSQGQQVLTTFFSQNKPTDFTVIHEGQSNGTKYFIGTYVSGETKYRVTVNVKTVGGADQISSISVEEA